jgi:chemotaxis protein methyltransferase CheR
MTAATVEAKAFDYIIALIYERCRIRPHEGKQNLIRSRLGKRMRHHGMETFEEYCHFLQNEADEEEFTQGVDALTTNFLREQEHFDFMVNTALPEVVTKGRPFTVWSAACATGEEPYSIAFYLGEHFPLEAGWNWRVMATDISTRALAKGGAGIYPLERAATVPKPWLKKFCQQGIGEWDGQFRIKPHIAARVTFQQINLLAPYSFREPFDLIFCRNVMIYFDRPTQEQLVNELSRYLVPDGHLLIGHSESLNGLDVAVKSVRPSVYKKK